MVVHLITMEETLEYFQRGDEFFDATKYMEAIKFFEKFVKFYNEHNEIDETNRNIKISEAYFRIGRSFLRLGKLNRSIESFSQALTCNPGHVFAYIMKGFALQDIQRRLEGEQMFKKALLLIEDNECNFNFDNETVEFISLFKTLINEENESNFNFTMTTKNVVFIFKNIKNPYFKKPS
jgi:tetratricopeptide (TPR) repeat protein